MFGLVLGGFENRSLLNGVWLIVGLCGRLPFEFGPLFAQVGVITAAVVMGMLGRCL